MERVGDMSCSFLVMDVFNFFVKLIPRLRVLAAKVVVPDQFKGQKVWRRLSSVPSNY
jgi:hypothetical protein